MKDYLSSPHPESLVDRLRGKYLGSAIPSGTYKTSPLHHEAADEIERLREEIASLTSDIKGLRVIRNSNTLDFAAIAHTAVLINELPEPPHASTATSQHEEEPKN